MPETRVPIITLLTDFGNADPYVSSLRGAILSVVTQVQIVDITHDLPAHDIAAAAYALRAAAPIFPSRTVHLVVVDPGVGGPRRPIVVTGNNQYFVGPDNGVFTFVYESDPLSRAYHVNAVHYFRDDPSPTFHGRDIFAPVAAQLARGIAVENFGEPIEDPVKVDFPRPKVTPEGRLRANIIHVDRFGNLVTNVTRGALDALLKKLSKSGLRGAGAAAAVTETKATYAEGTGSTPFFLINSINHLEIAAREGRACDLLSLKAGDTVEMDLV